MFDLLFPFHFSLFTGCVITHTHTQRTVQGFLYCSVWNVELVAVEQLTAVQGRLESGFVIFTRTPSMDFFPQPTLWYCWRQMWVKYCVELCLPQKPADQPAIYQRSLFRLCPTRGLAFCSSSSVLSAIWHCASLPRMAVMWLGHPLPGQ